MNTPNERHNVLKLKRGHEVAVVIIPRCDFCTDGTLAVADARIIRLLTWGNVCETHFAAERCSTGIGIGQRFVKV